MSCNSEGANFITQDSADDSKKVDKQQRMIVREDQGASTEKPEKEERGEFQFLLRFLKIAFTCFVIYIYNFWRLLYIIQELSWKR